MSRISEYRQLEQQIAQHQRLLEVLKGDPGLETEIEFETKLHDLLAKYQKQLGDVVSMLDRTVGKTDTAAAQELVRRARQVKVYRNPLTGEIVESKGGNNKLLGAWKAQFGHEEVESWVKRP
jgi:hypothetical protein